jgi:uncharacterized membrane protein YdjX (TVP38/TMEM64 family)
MSGAGNNPEAGRERRKARLREITASEALRNPRSWIAAASIVLAVAAGIYLNHRYAWLETIHLHIAAYHWAIVFLLVAALPIFGFSIVICYLVAGSKFGAVGGVAVMALAAMVHLLASHWIAKSFLRERIHAFIARRQYKLPHVPEGENASVSLMTAIIPGLPYCARNYLLALAGVPLRIYFWVCLPVYVIRSVLTICASGFSLNLTGNKVLFLGAIFLVKVGICAYVIKRLRDKSSRKHMIRKPS